ncbi:MAG TPA: metallophosphoesterase [Solirubrobacteraceae bacterium]|nr:metallophosphoesterase [Solirubrobacteraceae bacterium]
MRTLVISDLHLGNRARRDVLRRPGMVHRLVAALDDLDVGRLVLLGDTVELVRRQPQRSMLAAQPVLRSLARGLGPDREVVVVPGNHDAPLLRAWALAQGAALQASHAVPPGASPALERLVSWLGESRTRVSYPGVWLGERTWATHGHYLDHHLLPDSAFGLLRPARRDARPTSPIGYEHLHRRGSRSREPLPARLAARPVATVAQTAMEVARVLPRTLLRARMAPATSRLLDVQMRRAAVPAMARVVARLGIDADWVLFGHVHRRGPIGDEPWPGGAGSAGANAASAGPRLLNTGAWLYEALLVDRASPPHPYWPGGAILLEDGRAPRTVGLLDDVDAEQLAPTALSAG